MDADAIVQTLRGYRYSWRHEDDLHDQIEQVLEEAGLKVQREVVIGDGCRIDILVDGHLGIEVKVKGTAQQVARQLQRYGSTGALTALVLATTKAVHCAIPETLAGIPIRVAHLSLPF